MINPKLGLELLKNEIGKAVNHEFEKLEIFYYDLEQKIEFKIYLPDKYKLTDKNTRYKNDDRSHVYPFDDERSKEFCGIIREQLKDKITSNDIIDYAILKINGNNIAGELYYTTVLGTKEKLTYKYEL